jgi:hypothetical protein
LDYRLLSYWHLFTDRARNEGTKKQRKKKTHTDVKLNFVSSDWFNDAVTTATFAPY